MLEVSKTFKRRSLARSEFQRSFTESGKCSLYQLISQAVFVLSLSSQISEAGCSDRPDRL